VEHTLKVAREGDRVVVYHLTGADTAEPTPVLQVHLPDGDTVTVDDQTAPSVAQ
jgi:hypothetical protein